MHPGEKNLNTYRILFLIKGILDLLLVLIGIIYIAMGSVMSNAIAYDMASRGQHMPFDPGSLFTTVGFVLVALALITGIPALIASNKLQRREGRTFIIVAAAVNCLTGILGILLCIFTIIELQKPDVKEVLKD